MNNLTNNEQAVKSIMDTIDKEDNIGNIITQDLVNQEDSFRQKLENKRNKKKSNKDIQINSNNNNNINNNETQSK